MDVRAIRHYALKRVQQHPIASPPPPPPPSSSAFNLSLPAPNHAHEDVGMPPEYDPLIVMNDRDYEILVRYLAANDADCPSCGFQLRGLTQSRCPECGRQFDLRDVVRHSLRPTFSGWVRARMVEWQGLAVFIILQFILGNLSGWQADDLLLPYVPCTGWRIFVVPLVVLWVVGIRQRRDGERLKFACFCAGCAVTIAHLIAVIVLW